MNTVENPHGKNLLYSVTHYNDMTISEIQILPVKPKDGLFAYCSFVLDEKYYVGNVQVFTRPQFPGRVRLFYPRKKRGVSYLDTFHPLHAEIGQMIENAVQQKCSDLGLL